MGCDSLWSLADRVQIRYGQLYRVFCSKTRTLTPALLTSLETALNLRGLAEFFERDPDIVWSARPMLQTHSTQTWKTFHVHRLGLVSRRVETKRVNDDK